METNEKTRDPRSASHLSVDVTIQQTPTSQIQGLRAIIESYRLIFWEIYGPSPDLDRWREATVLEWQALVDFHSELAVAEFHLLVLTLQFRSSAELSRQIWHGVDAFLYLHESSRSQVTEPAIMMIDTAACIMALLFYYQPTDRETCVQYLRRLGSYWLKKSIANDNLGEQVTWRVVVGHTRSAAGLTADSETVVKSLLQLESIQRSGERVDRTVARLFKTYIAIFPSRDSIDLFLPAENFYHSVFEKDDDRATSEPTTEPTSTPSGQESGWGSPHR